MQKNAGSFGNRTNLGYTYNNLNMMTASPGHSYEHDILGNRTWRNPFSSTTVKYVWDDAGRLAKAAGPSNGATYSYRADGMRTKKVTGLTLAYIEDQESETSSGFYDEYQAVNHPTWRYRYDGQMCVEEDFTTVDGTTLTQTGTTYALGARGIDMLQPYSVDTSNWTRTYGDPQFPIYDGHGNMVASLTRDGQSYAVGNERQYDVWGGVRSGLSTGDPNTRYCATLGHKQDDESGLIYMRARYYEPGTGRFVSEDPARDGWNWFIYAANCPTYFVDQDGRSISNALGTWLSALLNVAGSVIGYYAAFFATVEFIQSMHPNFKPTPDWYSQMLGTFGTAATVMFTAKMNFGGGISVAKFMIRYGWKAFGIGFLIGALFGAYGAKVAWELYYIDHFSEID